jgi:hypothetical protein
LRDQALELISDAQTADKKDKEVLLRQVRPRRSPAHAASYISSSRIPDLLGSMWVVDPLTSLAMDIRR